MLHKYQRVHDIPVIASSGPNDFIASDKASHLPVSIEENDH